MSQLNETKEEHKSDKGKDLAEAAHRKTMVDDDFQHVSFFRRKV